MPGRASALDEQFHPDPLAARPLADVRRGRDRPVLELGDLGEVRPLGTPGGSGGRTGRGMHQSHVRTVRQVDP